MQGDTSVATVDQDHQPKPPAKEPAPLLWSRRTLAKAIDVSLPTLSRMESSGRIGPKALRLNRACVRYAAAEVEAWIRAGCPSRRQWEAMRKSQR
jgi:hypothetical protein